MARVRLIHWKAAEAAAVLAALEAAGHQVGYVEKVGSRLMGHLREQQPEVIVIDLSRLPSHGRMVAGMIRAAKTYRAVPLVFVHGEAEKVAQIRALFPDALYASTLRQMCAAVKKAKANPAAAVPAMAGVERPDRDTARKLGILANTQVSVIGAPRGYARVLGDLPGGAELFDVEQPEHPLTLWFVPNAAGFEERLAEARRWAGRTKLWIIWRKGSPDLTQLSMRRACAAFGLVDYKICSVDAVWSGMLFTVKK